MTSGFFALGLESDYPFGMRQTIRDVVEQIQPFDEIEVEHRSKTLAWIDSAAQLFRVEKPAKPPKHLVSYFAVIDGNKILLGNHVKAQLWLPSGGHVEPNEHLRETVKREVMEELSIDAKFLFEQPIFITIANTVGLTANHTDVSLWYVIKADSQIEIIFDRNEYHDVKWFRFDALPLNQTDPHLSRFIQKLKREL
jgi:8-oxo-dGTP diphosphatase